jgi:uncharacterized protein (DUF1330 family)
MPVYVVAQISITDRVPYERYQARFMPVLMKYEGRLPPADEAPLVAEGSWERDKVILFSFRDEAAFRRFAESPEYREIAVDRKAGSHGVVLMVHGLGLEQGGASVA